MLNFISIRGKQIELTDEQVNDLGFTVPDDSKIIDDIIKDGKLKDIIELAGREFKIIGISHDENADDPRKETITLMGTALLPSRKMHDGNCKDGWSGTTLRKYLNEEIIKELPDDLVKRICPVRKISHNSKGKKVTTTDKLYALSESELFGSAIYSDNEEGSRYPAFNTSTDRLLKDEDGDYYYYWTRSLWGGASALFCSVNSHGAARHRLGDFLSRPRPPVLHIIIKSHYLAASCGE